MAKDKLKRWAENKTFPHVFEPNLMPIIRENATFMKGLWREEFYKNNGATRSSHYFPFCDCYQGTEPCGESKYFKYNYLAIDMLKESFNHLFKTEKTEKFFISRERYNQKYQDQILGEYNQEKTVGREHLFNFFIKKKLKHLITDLQDF